MRPFIRSSALALLVTFAGSFASDADARTSFSLSIGVPIGHYGGGWYGGYWGGHGRYSHRHERFGFGYYAPMYYRPYYRPYAPRYSYYPRDYDRPYYRSYYRPYYGPLYSLGLFPAYVGDALSYDARGYYYDAYRRALSAPIGEAIAWNTGSVHGTVATTRDGWAGQRYCREFRQDVVIDGQTQEAYGTACQSPNGDWQLVANQE